MSAGDDAIPSGSLAKGETLPPKADTGAGRLLVGVKETAAKFDGSRPAESGPGRRRPRPRSRPVEAGDLTRPRELITARSRAPAKLARWAR